MPASRPSTLPAALVAAAKAKATGSIVSPAGAVTRLIWVRDGNPVYAESTDPKEGFAAILGKKGVLTDTEILLVEAETQRPGVREEQAIVASGVLGAAEVIEKAKVVFEERFLGAFAVPGATWTLEESGLPPELPTFEIPVASAVVRGIRERYGRDRLAVEFPVSDSDRYVYRPGALARHPRLNLNRNESRLTTFLDGKKGWRDVLAESGIDAAKAHAALYGLALLEVAEYLPPSALVVAPEAAPLPGAMPSRAVGHPAAGKGAEMRERMQKDLAALLDVPPEAAPEVAEQGFKGLAGRYDLGRAHFLDEGDRDAALALLDRAIDALLVMTHPEARAAWQKAPPWDRENVAAALTGRLAPEKAWMKAGLFMQAGNPLAAEAALLPALQLRPREAKYHLRMGICIYLRSKARDEEAVPVGAVRSLEKAVALDAHLDEGWLYLGHIAMAEGEVGKAAGYYHQALNLNPSNGEARRALSRFERN